MEKAERKNLVVKLSRKIQLAKLQAEIVENSMKHRVFVGYKFVLNPKYISNEEYLKIVQLYLLLKENDNLSENDIRNILKTKHKFAFLLKVDKVVPDFFNVLKLRGPMNTAINYVERRYNPKNAVNRIN